MAGSTGVRRPWWGWYVGAHLLLIGVAGVVPGAAVRGGLQLFAGAALAVAILAGIRLHRPAHPLPWFVLLAAIAVAVLTGTGWPALRTGEMLAAAGPSGIAPFVAYPLVALAVAVLPVFGAVRSPFDGLAEAGIITCGVGVVWWTMLIDPLVIHAAHPATSYHVIGYSMIDLTLLVLGVRVALVGAGPTVRLLLTGATVALLAGDSAWFLGPDTGAAPSAAGTACWLLTDALLGAAALHPEMAGLPYRDRPDNVAVPRVYVITAVFTPVISAAFLVREVTRGDVRLDAVIIPLLASTLTAGLVVSRMRQLNRTVVERATALQDALHSEAELQRELRRLAQHDPLTGLPNRTLLDERITALLSAGGTGSLLIIDVDNFKEVNDRFGHAVGDELLVCVATRLGQLIAPADLLARLDSDEFVVVVERADPEEPARLAADLLRAMRRPFQVQGNALFATVSVGVRTLEPDTPTSDALRDAYVALHAAKAAGRDQLTRYDRDLAERRLAGAQAVDRLRGAVDRGELLLHYQPLVRLADERMVGVEALLRWQPDGGPLVPPDQFIPGAEDSGLIVPIGAWVLREACRTVAGWHRLHGTIVSVNVSPRQLREPDFAVQVLDALRSSALPPTALILEITEGVLVASGQVTEQAIGHLTLLRAQGVRVAIDDFGTGYSSLAYLRNLPIDHLKIDRSFMPAPGSPDQAARTIVKAVIDLAGGLDLGTIAEGVETAEQVALLRELGCERAQGYFFARPVPAAEAAQLLAGSPRRAAV